MILRPLAVSTVAVIVAACVPQATPTYFIPPTLAALPESAPPVESTAIPSVLGSPESPAPVAPSATPPCTNDLEYVQDLTIPDGSTMPAGQLIDKRWQVRNGGTCNWDERYRLHLVGGDSMGAAESLPLYPARAGTQATLRILFTAPQAAGTYESQWQAVDPDGATFGDTFYVQILVRP